jgi:uncharacterized YccA/Bax inhibitor family protein
MPNPLLNDKAFEDANKAGYAAGAWGPPQSRSTPLGGPVGTGIDDGPVSRWDSRTMSIEGTATATGVLFVLLIAAGAVGWQLVETVDGVGVTKFPTWSIAGVLIGLACVIGIHFKPQLAKILGPIYALAEGVFIGAISHAYEGYKNGIVVQAVGATIAVFAVMLFMYRTKIIKVTDRFRRIIFGATFGIMIFYGISLLINLFGGDVSFLRANNGSLFSIGVSLFVAAIAAFNLALDFDFIERGSKQGLPKQMEWVAAVGLLVTVIWLYLEILRLLAKLNSRR